MKRKSGLVITGYTGNKFR